MTTKKTAAVVTDAEVLRYMGLLGHPFAVTCAADDKGNRRSLGECNDEATARRWASEQREGRAFAWRTRGGKRVAVELKPRNADGSSLGVDDGEVASNGRFA